MSGQASIRDLLWPAVQQTAMVTGIPWQCLPLGSRQNASVLLFSPSFQVDLVAVSEGPRAILRISKRVRHFIRSTE